jgi:hypothetical protein
MKELTAEKVWAVTSEKTYLFIKRLIDIIGGLVGLILLIPISIIIKILTIATGDFNSIFFSQKRIGKDGKEFNFYKFRSMVPNADKILFEMLEKDPEMAKEYKKLGFLFGIGGVVTYKNGKTCKEVTEGLSLEDIVLETDAPYLAPTPYRGKTNVPKYIKEVAKEVSIIKNISIQEVEDATFKNACNFFEVNHEN